MKIKDIKVGETYAKNWGSVTVNGIHLGGKLPEGFKYFRRGSWHGNEYTEKKVILVTDDHGNKFCVSPQELKAPIAVWEAKKEAEQKARDERYAQENAAREARKVAWLKLAPALEAAEIDTWRGVECGTDTIEVTAEQLEKLLGGK